MDENRIQQIVQREIQASAGRAMYAPTNIPFHVHNGVDSPIVFSPTNIYTGFIPSDAVLNGSSTGGFIFIPQGWTASVDTGGTPILYTVIHNLNTSFYTVNCSLYGPEAVNAAIPNVVCLPDRFYVAWYDSALVSYQTDFSFQLIQINNSTQNVPLYTAVGG